MTEQVGVESLSDKPLAGKVAVVTGAGGGIGSKICLELAKEGAHIVAADSNEGTARAISDQLNASGNRSLPVKMDVTSSGSISNAISMIIEHLKSVDILVNNAGVLTLSPLLDLSESDWDFVLDVNAKGVFLCTKLIAKEMIRLKKSGVIVNIASIAAKVPISHQIHYCASKAAVIALTKVSAQELAPYGIRVNAVCPGAVDTEMFSSVLRYEAEKSKTSPEEIKNSILSNMSLGRLIRPEEIGKTVAFLCSDAASVISGQAINIDGGNVTVNY